MVFLLLYRTDVRSGTLRRVLRKVSVLSLDMYLSSLLAAWVKERVIRI